MSKKPFTPEQRERRRAYLKAGAPSTASIVLPMTNQRQKRREQRRADNARWYEVRPCNKASSRSKCFPKTV
jgi:hypothetical protein